MEDFITGFFDLGKINGRPADIFNFGDNAFLLTDDHAAWSTTSIKKPDA